MNQALRGKVALVAGATRGEGRGIAPEPGSRPRVCTACVTTYIPQVDREEHFAENITLDQLAQIAHLSPYHLNWVFSQTFGLPLHKYRLQLQVEQARSLLLQGMPLRQVAVETGFTDQSHLTRHFKRLMRVTPGQCQPQDRKNVQGFGR